MKEKVIACIGDSLTEGDYGVVAMAGIANVQEKNYPHFLKELSGCKVKNHGHCGFTSVMILDLFKNSTIKVDDADIIVVVLGTNGGQSEEGNSENDLAYKEIIRLCREQSPKAKIFICTPPRPTQDKTMLESWIWIKNSYPLFLRMRSIRHDRLQVTCSADKSSGRG